MRRYAFVLSIVVLTISCSTASAQISSPYPDTALQMSSDSKLKLYDDFTVKSKTLYFAASCGILSGLASGEWGATVIVREDALCHPDSSDSAQLLLSGERAREEGRNLKKFHGCGFWKEHAEEVYTLKAYAERRVVNALDLSIGGRMHCPQL